MRMRQDAQKKIAAHTWAANRECEEVSFLKRSYRRKRMA
jgi:hypothetical protein